MAILENINVIDSDLEAICPDISSYKFENQEDFSNEIQQAKKYVYGLIKEDFERSNPDMDEADVLSYLNKVKDYTDQEYLKDKIAKTAISIIFRQNKLYDDMNIYLEAAKSVPLIYYIDQDLDNIADKSEEMVSKRYPTFGR